ncbi:MAG: hypothetical protein Q8P64_22260 [Deltaproteobacteria bacterium]|nr:hypothetical protein [Deltaproteobacteria bacterium]
MFARIKKSGRHQYLQIVENHREGSKTVQRVISTIGRMDQLQAKGDIEKVIRSLSRFSEKVLLVLYGKSEVHAFAKKIGPSLALLAPHGVTVQERNRTGDKDNLHLTHRLL